MTTTPRLFRDMTMDKAEEKPEQIKEARGVSGIYFRYYNPHTKECENRVFEDLPEADQDRTMEGRSEEWLRSLAKSLAASLYNVCEKFDITTIREEE